MAKSFKEIGKKAEALIEQGKEADQKVQSCQARVASSNSRVAAARRQLAAASETDEEGNPVGDVEQARAQLSMAENQLAASQRALSSARGDADRVRQQKNAHVQEIERHNQVERSNLEKLRRLRAGAFGADSAALTEGMAQRLNEAEDARVALLRSMGIDATPDHVAVGGESSADSGWRGGGFATLDTTGHAQSYQGGNSEGLPTGGGIAAPVGGGLGKVGDPLISREDAQQGDSSKQSEVDGITQNSMSHNKNVDAYGVILGEESAQLSNIDNAYESVIDGSSIESSHWNGRPRTPNEVLADMKKAIRENWMNNFNAAEWKSILPSKLYEERLELYRHGLSMVIGEERAAALTTEELEGISHVQNHAHKAGITLTESELRGVCINSATCPNNPTTPEIQKRMDLNMRTNALQLLKSGPSSEEAWDQLGQDVDGKKHLLTGLLVNVNSILGTDVTNEIEYFRDESLKTRGYYNPGTNKVYINECYLTVEDGYQVSRTVIHEMRHAYQKYAITHPEKVLASRETIKAWAGNQPPFNYKSTSAGYSFEEYVGQPVEWDAKSFAGQLMELRGATPEYRGSW